MKRSHGFPRDPGECPVLGPQKLSSELFASLEFLGQFLRSLDWTFPRVPRKTMGPWPSVDVFRTRSCNRKLNLIFFCSSWIAAGQECSADGERDPWPVPQVARDLPLAAHPPRAGGAAQDMRRHPRTRKEDKKSSPTIKWFRTKHLISCFEALIT